YACGPLRALRLEAPPGRAVARDDDRAPRIDAERGELLVIGGEAVVDIDEGRGDVSVDRIDVVGRKLGGSLRRRWIPVDGSLREARPEADRRRHLHDALPRRRGERVEPLHR